MVRYLKEWWTPGLLGFDPMMQLIHQNDVEGALIHALHHPASGVFNIAADDALPLNKIRGMVGKPPVSVLHPIAYWGANLLGSSGLGIAHWAPIELDYIRYSWVADLSRMHDVLNFEPYYTAEEAVREFADSLRMDEYEPEAPPSSLGEERLRDVLEQRRRQRERETAGKPSPEEGQADD
jgi:UDP-glucose 4-epimerase